MHVWHLNVYVCVYASLYRVLVSGQVFSSIGYGHGTKTNDYTLCYAESPNSTRMYGLAVKYVSYCTKQCPPNHSYCHHSILIRPLHPVSEPFVINEEAGTSARHIQAVLPGRLDYGYMLHIPYSMSKLSRVIA